MFARVDRDIEKRGAEGRRARSTTADFALRHRPLLAVQALLHQVPVHGRTQKHEWLDRRPRACSCATKAQRARRNGVTLQDQVLGEPGSSARWRAAPLAPLTNFVNANRLVRKVNEKVLGISSEFPRPHVRAAALREAGSRTTSRSRARGKRGHRRALRDLHRRLQLPGASPPTPCASSSTTASTSSAPSRPCCGIPNLDGGDIDSPRKAKARFNVASLARGDRARAEDRRRSQPTCSYTIKKEYPELLGTADARKVAANTLDLMEYARAAAARRRRSNRDFQKGLGKVAYHAACHLRAQKIGVPGRARPRRPARHRGRGHREVLGRRRHVGDEGAVLRDGPQSTRRSWSARVDGAEAKTVVTDCPLSALRIAEGERRPRDAPGRGARRGVRDSRR